VLVHPQSRFYEKLDKDSYRTERHSAIASLLEVPQHGLAGRQARRFRGSAHSALDFGRRFFKLSEQLAF